MLPKYKQEQKESGSKKKELSLVQEDEMEQSENNAINDDMLYELLIDNIMKVKENLGNRRDFPFPDDDKLVRI